MVRRIAWIAGIMVILGCIVLPPVLGARARNLIEPRLHAMTDALGPDLIVAVWLDNWDAGWFSSTATVTLDARFGQQGGDTTTWPDLAGSYRTTMPRALTLRHGPVIVGDRWRVGWGSAEFAIDATTVPKLQEFLAETGVGAVARLTALVSFLGGTAVTLEIPPIRTFAEDTTEFRFAGLDAIASINPDGTRGSSSGTLHRLGFANPGVSAIELGRLEWAGDAHKSAAIGYWLGTAVVKLEHVDASDAGERVFEMAGARLETETRADHDDIVGTNRYTAVRIRFGGLQFDDVELDVAATYPVAAAARLADSAVNAQLSTEAIADALRQRITVRVDPLSFRHADLPFTATLDVEYRGDQHRHSPVAADLWTLASLTSAELSASMHKNLVQAVGIDDLTKLVPKMARLGLVRESGDEYQVHATYRDGELLFDGKPVDAALLVALMAGT